jgi:Spy/CpxP family protein refolding chaperone
MKTLKTKIALLFTVLLISSQLNLFAQPMSGNKQGRGNGYDYGQGYCMNAIPDLTEDQKTRIEDLRIAHMKEMQNFRNQISEKRAHLTILQTADNVDMKAVNSTIDEITSLKNKQMKSNAAHRQKVRSLLTDNQKVYFDTHVGRKGYGKGMGQGHRGSGHGYGRGNCSYR